jgi:GntR family transcriptional regulator, carbon starvation induced regulator
VIPAFPRLAKVSERNPADPWQLVPEFERYHAAFHCSLPAGCNSPLVLQMRDALCERWERYRHSYLAHVAAQRHYLMGRRALREAAFLRNAGRTMQLLRRHFAIAVNSLLGHGIPGTTKSDGSAALNNNEPTNR